jgi:2-methylcitrate dehydratase PrpD
MPRQVTRELSEWIAGLRLDDVPAEVVERAKLIIADITAIALRGRNDSESTPPLLAAVESMDLSHGRFRVIGDPASYAATGATLINATCAHSLEMDDTFSPRGTHTSCVVVPAALTAAQMADVSGETLLLAIIAGLETMCRVGLGRDPEAPRDFHATPTTGAFGATAAAAKALGLTAQQIEHAFGIALSNTAGNMQFHVNGAWTKRVQIGFASTAGLTAAALAREGYTGSTAALEGEHGFYRLYAAGKGDPDRVLDGLGQQWQILEIAFKPHSSCRGTHAAIDAAIDLRNQHAIRFEDIDRVTVGLPRRPIDLIELLAAPNKIDPQTHVEGQFSITFTVAAGLRLGRLGVDDYETQFRDPSVRSLMARTEVFEDPEAVMLKPGTAAGSVRLRLKDGSELHRIVTVPRGEPENMISREEARRKFDSLVAPFLTDAASGKLYELILVLEKEPAVAGYFAAATPDRIPAK